jgi:hypothetical protein
VTSIERDHRCIGNEVVEQGLGADIVVLRCHSGRAECAWPRGCRGAALRRLRGDGPQAPRGTSPLASSRRAHHMRQMRSFGTLAENG